ncbi:MAG: DnaD domain protein [Firmicutes bacterium]|nr:DnaD domain protein [Bacillota bacterium]
MAGWVKLWRKLKENGHLKMPGTAFKLWIYCLLEATPYQDRARDLEAGELWLNYEHVRQVIGEAGRQMSKSTVSSAMKYLEQNGYLELQAKQFYGVKARVANWQEYQSGTETVPARVQKSYPASTDTVPGKNPEKTRPNGIPGTETVLGKGPPSTPASTETVPVTVPVGVLVREPEAYSGEASSAPKNIKNIKNKDLYIDPAAAAIASEFEREFGRLLSPIEVNKLASWQKTFSDELIKEALARAALQDKRSIAYVGGILKSWRRAGITTVEEARREQAGPGTKGGKRNANHRSKPGYRPSEVDWANEPDTL